MRLLFDILFFKICSGKGASLLGTMRADLFCLDSLWTADIGLLIFFHFSSGHVLRRLAWQRILVVHLFSLFVAKQLSLFRILLLVQFKLRFLNGCVILMRSVSVMLIF
jgi:hypothetical protein